MAVEYVDQKLGKLLAMGWFAYVGARVYDVCFDFVFLSICSDAFSNVLFSLAFVHFDCTTDSTYILHLLASAEDQHHFAHIREHTL
jgi:hypothetical protein